MKVSISDLIIFEYSQADWKKVRSPQHCVLNKAFVMWYHVLRLQIRSGQDIQSRHAVAQVSLNICNLCFKVLWGLSEFLSRLTSFILFYRESVSM